MSIADLVRRTYGGSPLTPENMLEREWLEQLLNGGAGLGALPVGNMDRGVGGANVPAGTTGQISGGLLPLRAGQVLNKIACWTRTTAGATLTHRWVCLYTPGGVALAKQSTDITTATVGANAFLEFSLASSYTVPSDGLYLVGINWTGTTIPSMSGVSLGVAARAQPAFTGFTTPFYAWTAGSGLTATAPAGPLTLATTANLLEFWAY